MTCLNRGEKAGVIFALSLSPLWFFNPLGFTIADFVIFIVGLSYVFRNRKFPLLPTGLISIGGYLFLFIVIISLLYTPAKIEGLKRVFLYTFIFVLVIPLSLKAFSNKSVRWYGTLALSISLNTLAILTLVIVLTADIPYDDITLWYGNQNQLYWLIASGYLVNICLSAEREAPRLLRTISFIMAVICFVLVVIGLTLTAIIMAVGGSWIIIGLLLQQGRFSVTGIDTTDFIAGTLLIMVVTLWVIISNWNWVYYMGSLETRQHDYYVSIIGAIELTPFGSGIGGASVLLDSVAKHTSIHNFLIRFWFELGIAGIASFLLFSFGWVRDVLISSYSNSSSYNSFEFIGISIFSMHLVVLLFQPIVLRRYWWFIFALGFSTILGKNDCE